MSFIGFNPSDISKPSTSFSQSNSSSNSEASDYETGADRVVTPKSKLNSSTPGTIKKKSKSVKQLIHHFSSDSDTAAEQSRTLRRRRSETSELLELPAGGEKEIRKIMAEQKKVEHLTSLYLAMQDELVTSMDEVETEMSSDIARSDKLGYLASLTTQFEDMTKYWGKLEEASEKPGVSIDIYAMIMPRNKAKVRYSKIIAQLVALTEATPAATTPTMRIINPTSFGNIGLPQFAGDYVEFDNFEATFKNLIDNGNLDDGGKLAHLMNNIKGEAREYIGRDGLAQKTYEGVWGELRARYGKPWRITRAAVKNLISLKDPESTPQDITRYWNQINESCKIAERLKLTATSVILNMALLKLPSDFRSKMDDKLKAVSDSYILTRENVAEPFNDIIAGEVEKPSGVIATLGYNTTTAAGNNKNPRNSGQPNPQAYNNPAPRNIPNCYLCLTKGHRAYDCPIYTSGPLIAERLRILGRCMRCAVPRLEHGQECTHRVHCRQHPGQRHLFYTCNTFVNRKHVPQPARPQHPPNRMIAGRQPGGTNA